MTRRIAHILTTLVLVVTLALPMGAVASGLGVSGGCGGEPAALDTCEAPIQGAGHHQRAPSGEFKAPCLTCVLSLEAAEPVFTPRIEALTLERAGLILQGLPPDPLRRPPRA